MPDFEDPKFAEDGTIDDMSLPKDVDMKTGQAAHEECQRYLPNGGEPEKSNPEDLAKLRAYATCMRENGMPDFPDPDSEGSFRFEYGRSPDPDSPELKAANETCKHNLPGGGGGMIIGPEKDK